MTSIETIDARGLLCPLPVLKLRKRMKSFEIGQTIELLTDDPAAVIDVPHFCNESGHVLEETLDAGGHMVFRVRKSV
jgi:tRNA 2-thiouridine synthesizing protein A